jgi:hypothetical protein
LGSTQSFFGNYFATNNNSQFYVMFDSSNCLNVGLYTLSAVVTTAVYRDPSAWYHIVILFDSTQATASNRLRLFVNGVEITSFSTDNRSTLTLNGDFAINAAQATYLGYNNVAGYYFDGYLTEINFIDGQALTPSSFGMTDPQTGVWEPIRYTGTYGTNGFYLNFKDATSTTTLGNDYSGNSNNWTTNNFSVTAGSGNDSLTDVPTPWIAYNTTGDVGGVVRGNYATADALTPQGSAQALMTLANGNLQLSHTSSNYGQRFGNIRVNSGKWYYEWTVTNTGFPSLQCGWFSGQAYPTLTGGAGQATGGSAIGYWTGANLAVSTYAGGLFGGSISSQTWSNGDVIMVAVDFDAGKIWFGKNGTFYSSGNPATGANPIDTWTASSSLNFAPWFVAYGTTTDTYVNFGQRPFAYTPPAGFLSLCTTNLPTPTIGATTATQAGKYFNPVLYTGNTSGASVTGVGFAPEFIWTKNRSTASNHELIDIVRGGSSALFSNLTNAQATQQRISSFNSDGWTYTTDSNSALADSFVGWCWNAGGSNATNTSGTITSTVRANTTAGFSIVTYTGTGANATVGHGLGVAPAMIIYKLRTGTTTAPGWPVWHKNLATPTTGTLRLNTTAAEDNAATYFNSTIPSSTVFSLGTSVAVNESTSTYVAYCFAAVAGYSAFGSYTGNGSSDGPFIYTGFRPRYVFVKVSSGSTGSWVLHDTARNPYNVADAELFPNTTNAENVGSRNKDILSNGFKLRCGGGLDSNDNGSTYIYAAFAESPFKFALAR